MRKYVWTALAGLAIVAAAGLVNARGGFIRTHAEGTSASASTNEEPSCPLNCLWNYCCNLGR